MKKYVVMTLIHIFVILLWIPKMVSMGLSGETTINWEFGIAFGVATLIGYDVWRFRRQRVDKGTMLVGQIFLTIGVMAISYTLLGIFMPNYVRFATDVQAHVGVLFAVLVCSIFTYYTIFENRKECNET